MKKCFPCLLTLALAAALMVPSAGAAYTDVPAADTLAVEVEKATEYGLMNGYGNGVFGFKDSMTRAQFVTVLGRMLGWFEGAPGDHVTPEMQVDPPSRNTPNSVSDVYWASINAAAEWDVVDLNQPFRPNDAITRGEMAEMLVRALGLKSAAAASEKENSLPFTDVTSRKGYISVAYDVGMTKGTSATTFAPNATATRAQAAAMLLRIYEKLQADSFSHAYYAISSYSQMELGTQADAVTLGWSRMTWDGSSALLATTSKSSYEYYVPNGYQDVVAALEEKGVKTHLGVYMDTSNAIADMLASPEGCSQAVSQIVNELTVDYKALGHNPYSGVTIDFEGLRAGQKDAFTAFLKDLSAALKPLGKTLYVCVSPTLTSGPYFDGYDYHAIGEAADLVILMAYDYDARNLQDFVGTAYYKTAAAAPIDQVYMSLRSVTDPETGVADPGKVLMGFSCKNVAWKIDEAGNLLSGTPVYPSNDTVAKRLAQEDTIHGWSDTYGMPYAIYTADGDTYFLWYEDARSTALKQDTAKLFGLSGVSLWRLGTIPDYDSWNWSELLK